MNLIFLILLKLEHLKLGYKLAPSMPRGNGMTYDHAACKAAVEEFVLGLEVGDVFHYLDIVEHLSSYKGLSRKDKENKYSRSASFLMRSVNYFMHVVKLVLDQNEIQYRIRGHYQNRYLGMKTPFGFDVRYAGPRRVYEIIGE